MRDMANPSVTTDTAAPATTSAPTDSPSRATARMESLDQFRGFAIFAMVLVNYLGHYTAMPETFRHHPWSLSFADMVVPMFLFAIGIGYRMTFLRRMRKEGVWRARLAAFKRYGVIVIIGLLAYGFDYNAPNLYEATKWRLWDTLVQIGLAGLVVLPFIERRTVARLALGLAYLAVFQLAYDSTGYGRWLQRESFEAGPLGMLTRQFPLVLGTVAYDLLALGDRKRLIAGSLVMGSAAIIVGYLLSLRWGFSKPYDSMPYVIFAGGFSAFVYLGFYLLADIAGRSVPTLTAVGRNALTIYLVQLFLLQLHYLPPATPAVVALAAFAVLYMVLYAVARYLDRSGYYIRI